MRRGMLVALLVTVGLTLTAGAVAAQPKSGDLVWTVYGTGGGLYYAPWGSSRKTLNGSLTLNAVKVMGGTANYVYTTGGSTGNVYRFSHTGVQYTVTTVTTGGAALALGQDGSYLLASSADYKIYRVYGSSATVWCTINTVYGLPNGICRDGNTGDFMVATHGAGRSHLLRVYHNTQNYSRLSSLGSTYFYGIDWVPQTGYFACAESGYFRLRTSSGSVVRSYAVSGANCVTVDQKTGRIYVGTGTGRIYRFSYTGVYQGYTTHGGSISGVDIWNDQNVTLYEYTSGSNTFCRAYLRFPDSGSKPYYVGISLAPRTGVRLSTYNWINIRPDTLFFTTFAGRLPYFTSGFVGTLSSSGTGYAYFSIPFTVTRTYVTAVAINAAKLNGVDVGNVEVIDRW